MKPEYQNWQVETATSSRSDEIEYFIRRDGDSVAVASDIINPETEQPSKEIADMLCAAPDLLAALKALTSNPHINLGDLVYKVRDSEGEGWDGPHVKQWSDAVQSADAAIAKAERKA